MKKIHSNALSYSIKPVNKTERITRLAIIQLSQNEGALLLKLEPQEGNDHLETQSGI